jgi:DNA-binding SARP family transcriptional activator
LRCVKGFGRIVKNLLETVKKHGSGVAAPVRGEFALLQLRLLGSFEASDAARAKGHRDRRQENRALLGYLALQPNQSATRGALANLLWSDRDEAHARNSLRQSLLSLKKDLGEVHPAPIQLQEDLIGLTPGQVMIDVLRFKQLAVSSALGDLQAAVSGYTGAFLEQLSIRDPSYEEWVADSRSHLAELLGSTLERLWQRQEGEERIASLRQLLSFDPTREAAHRALMTELARHGDLAGALQQYERCKSLLRQELDVAPSAETETVRRQIFEGRVPTVQSEPSTAPASVPVPAVVVLPFFNVGGDPEQQYFSDGITNDLTTDLSRFPAFRVIASHSAFAVRTRGQSRYGRPRAGCALCGGGQRAAAGPPDPHQCPAHRRTTGHHIWSERYNRSLRALLFPCRTRSCATSSRGWRCASEISEREAALRKPTKSLEAYDYYLRGQEDWSAGRRRAAGRRISSAGRSSWIGNSPAPIAPFPMS